MGHQDFNPTTAALADWMQIPLNLFRCWKELEPLSFEDDTQVALPPWHREDERGWNKCDTSRSLPFKQESLKTYASRDILKVWNKCTSLSCGKGSLLSSSISFNCGLQERQLLRLHQKTLIKVKSCLAQSISHKQENYH